MNDGPHSPESAGDRPTAEDGRTERLTPRNVTILGMAINLALSLIKVVAGLIFASQTILVDGLHSASDLLTDLAVLTGLRVSNKPADPDHPYGHRRASTLVSLFVGVALIAAAGYIAYDALETIRGDRPAEQTRPLWPFVAAIVSIVSKEFLFRITQRVGRACNDSSVLANAWHHRSDAFSSIAAAAGLAGVWIGGPAWQFLDPVTAVVLTTFLVRAGWRIIRSAAHELMDAAPDSERLERISRVVDETPGVISHHEFRARMLGGKVEMDIHVQVDPTLSVYDGHEIAADVRRRIVAEHPDVQACIVHIEPAETNAEPSP